MYAPLVRPSPFRPVIVLSFEVQTQTRQIRQMSHVLRRAGPPDRYKPIEGDDEGNDWDEISEEQHHYRQLLHVMPGYRTQTHIMMGEETALSRSTRGKCRERL